MWSKHSGINKSIQSCFLTPYPSVIMTRARPSSDVDDAPPAKKRQKEPKQSENYHDIEGDLEILSSDNVLFKLHAYRFQASSSVLLYQF